MTRYDKELRKRGYKLENDYPWLPYEVGIITIEAVNTKIVDNSILIITCSNVGCDLKFLDRNFSVVDRYFI